MSDFTGFLILASIGVALVCAAFYALFGRPSSDKGKKHKQEVISGFRLAGGILLGMALMGLLVFGAATAFGSTEGTDITPVRRLGAPAAALLSLFLITITVQRWAKYFAGWIVWGVLNALITASTGHLLSNPSIPSSRRGALALAGLFSIQVLATIRFRKEYKLHLSEKAALIIWILAFTWAAVGTGFEILAMSIASAALAAAWWYQRGERHRGWRRA